MEAGRPLSGDTSGLDPLEALAELEAAVDAAVKVFGEGLWRLGESELVGALGRLHCLDGKSRSLWLGTLREVETRGVPAAVGATSLASYLSQSLRMTPGLAREAARLSESLATRHTPTATALANAEISYEQAKAISETVDGLPAKATPEHKDIAEAFLISKSATYHAGDLRRMGKHMDDWIDPDGSGEREDAARSKRGAHVKDNHDGTQRLTWVDTDENMALAKAAIEALAAPVPGEDGERDPRQAAERRADALVDLCRRALDTGEFDPAHGVRPHLHLTFPEATLRGEPGAPTGTTGTGEHLCAKTIERLSCDATITGIVLNGNGVPLKLGRTRRTVSMSQWIALQARDTGCQFPGCTRPARWTQAHHLVHWAHGGHTDLSNLALFCTIHHHYLHDKGWNARIGADGLPEVIPPPWIDSQQRPRRNTHWNMQHELAKFTPRQRQ